MKPAKLVSRVSLVSGVIIFLAYTLYSTIQAGWIPVPVPQLPVIPMFLTVLLMSFLFGTSFFIEGEIIDEDETESGELTDD